MIKLTDFNGDPVFVNSYEMIAIFSVRHELKVATGIWFEGNPNTLLVVETPSKIVELHEALIQA